MLSSTMCYWVLSTCTWSQLLGLRLRGKCCFTSTICVYVCVEESVGGWQWGGGGWLICLSNYFVLKKPTYFYLLYANLVYMAYHLHINFLRHKCFSLNDPFSSWAYLANIYQQHLGFSTMKLFTAVLISALLWVMAVSSQLCHFVEDGTQWNPKICSHLSGSRGLCALINTHR